MHTALLGSDKIDQVRQAIEAVGDAAQLRSFSRVILLVDMHEAVAEIHLLEQIRIGESSLFKTSKLAAEGIVLCVTYCYVLQTRAVIEGISADLRDGIRHRYRFDIFFAEEGIRLYPL